MSNGRDWLTYLRNAFSVIIVYFANTTSSCALGLAEAGAEMTSHGISITLFKPSRTHLRFSCTTCSPRLPKYLRMYFGKRGEHVVQENLKCVREGLKSVMEIPWDIISAPASAKPKAQEEVVFAK